MGFEIDDAKLRRAGLDYWHLLDLTYYDSLDEYLAVNANADIYLATTKGKGSYCEARYSDNCHLLFGSETKGLPECLHARFPDRTIRIPQYGDVRCLNLSNAVAVVAYEALKQLGFPDMH